MLLAPPTYSMESSGKIKVKGAVMRQMLKPILFGNHQTMFGYFTFLVSAGITFYMVFRHDFGESRHCFSWLREYTEIKKRQFFSISPDDKILLQKQNVITRTPPTDTVEK